MAQVLRPLQGIFQPQNYPNLIVGLEQPDDSAVYRISDDQAIIMTADFFTPVVDDPYHFGAIAAANALSDVYAMGGEPLVAINLVAFPDGYGLDLLSEILRGGAEKVRESGAVIAGGHTVTDKEPKYGLSVTGRVHPDKIMTKGGAQPGDVLILTKPLGVGVLTTGIKQERTSEADIQTAIASMSRLNRTAALAVREVGVNALTDITGYGLLGHGHEMAHLSQVSFELSISAFEWLNGAKALAEQDVFPGGMGRNREYFEQWTSFEDAVTPAEQGLLFDPQTSGGLLIAVAPDKAPHLVELLLASGDSAQIIGHVTGAHPAGHIHVTR